MNDLTADLARANFRAERAEQRATRAERHNDRLVRELATRDGITEAAARVKHLPPEGDQ